jgi:crotonobetainyl-CoA:carnitine CoA-transferase CaiB-like acyl-CoA transferase
LVLDLSTFLSGPFCTQVLGDLGARIIKVERLEGGGDYTRHLPPYFVRGTSAYFHSTNRNKESVVIDLKRAEGRDLFLRLVERADVVVENYRPGVMERLELGYATLAGANPRIVLVSISGFGQDGPYKERPAYDMIVQALSGSMSVTGEVGRPPVRMGVPLGCSVPSERCRRLRDATSTGTVNTSTSRCSTASSQCCATSPNTA